MLTLIFATNNRHKADEIQAVAGNKIRVVTLQQAGIRIDIPEPFDSLKANASEKSRTIYALTGKNCFSEDTGLEVAALDGAPGVRSARYAAEDSAFQDNVTKLLHVLAGNNNRYACFRTVISLQLNGKEYFFDGICEGTITDTARGTNGFGYDPVFMPAHSNKTFGEMSLDEKTQFSHRRKACDKLVSFLHQAVNLL